MAGRRPKPTHLKIVAGNPGHRPLNQCEPQPCRAMPAMPAHISDAARAIWPDLASRLHKLGVLTEADGVALRQLCEACAQYDEALAELERHGSNQYETTSSNGCRMVRAHPAVGVMQDADRRIKAWLVEFGLTPSARSRVSAAPLPPDGDDNHASRHFDP